MSASHDFLTECMLRMLPDRQQVLWAPAREALVREYCWYPDWYYGSDRDRQSAARPYVITIDEHPFHYVPANAVESDNWRVRADGTLQRLPNQPNRHWHHVSRGFTLGLDRVIERLRAGDIDEAARHAGPLLHVIEDAGAAMHCLEGPDGTDPFVLERLLRPPTDEPAAAIGNVLRQPDAVDFDASGFRPTLLGARVDEAVLHLYARYCRMVSANRLEVIPYVQHTWDGRADAARACVGRMNRAMCALGADLLHTAACLASGRLDAEELAPLRAVRLGDLQPIHRPYFLPGYTIAPLVADHSLDEVGQRVPLRLRLDGSVRQFDRGIGTGCHAEYLLAYDLPAGVYESFTGAVGLHAELGRSGGFATEMRLGGRKVWEADFNAAHPAGAFAVPVSPGGMLELYVRDRTGDWANPANHVVWAEPRLRRRPFDAVKPSQREP